jgi:hypothetical protein
MEEWSPEDDFLLLSAIRANMNAAEIASYVPFHTVHTDTSVRARRELLFPDPQGGASPLQEVIDQIPVTRKMQLWDRFQAHMRYWKSRLNGDPSGRAASFSLPSSAVQQQQQQQQMFQQFSNQTDLLEQQMRAARRPAPQAAETMGFPAAPQRVVPSDIDETQLLQDFSVSRSRAQVQHPQLIQPTGQIPQSRSQSISSGQAPVPIAKVKKERFHPYQKDLLNPGGKRADVGYVAILKQVLKRKKPSGELDFFVEVGEPNGFEHKMEGCVVCFGCFISFVDPFCSA